MIREVLTIAGIGMALGLPAAWWLSRYVASQLYGVRPPIPSRDRRDRALTLVALVAGLVPSARAARVSPTTALRYE